MPKNSQHSHICALNFNSESKSLRSRPTDPNSQKLKHQNVERNTEAQIWRLGQKGSSMQMRGEEWVICRWGGMDWLEAGELKQEQEKNVRKKTRVALEL